MSRATDVRIVSVETSYQEFHYRTPIKFGGVALDRATQLDLWIEVESTSGKRSRGFGSMPLSNVWAFPSRSLTYDQTLGAMTTLAGRIADLTRQHKEVGHPVDLGVSLEPLYVRAAEEVTRQTGLAEPIPHLAVLVTASPFDAALHDAYGKLHGLNCYHSYGPDFMNHDLGHYLGKDFSGETLDRYVRREPLPRMPLYHL